MKKVLYIIGNGFDRHHGLRTSYFNFAIYLKELDLELYDLLQQYISFPSKDNDLWNCLEENLAYLDYETILDENTDYLPNLSSDEFRDRDWHAFEQVVGRIVDSLTAKLYDIFKDFILDVDYPIFVGDKLLDIDINSLFFNFNYTVTFEKYYKIEPNNILYVHNKAERGGKEVILGHGVDPKQFEEEPVKPPEGLSDEELERWREEMNDQFDYAYDTGKFEMMSYFDRSFKHTEDIINQNQNFFKKLSKIEFVFVLGHSLSDVDLPYISKIFKSIKPNAKWTVTYWGNREKESHLNTLVNLGIEEQFIEMVEMTDLQQPSNQLKLKF
jgi:hypothetical protein